MHKCLVLNTARDSTFLHLKHIVEYELVLYNKRYQLVLIATQQVHYESQITRLISFLRTILALIFATTRLARTCTELLNNAPRLCKNKSGGIFVRKMKLLWSNYLKATSSDPNRMWSYNHDRDFETISIVIRLVPVISEYCKRVNKSCE